MAKIGDIVRFLDTVGGGRITRIDGQVAYVDEDGFETPVMLNKCVVVASADSQAAQPKPQSPAPSFYPSSLKTTGQSSNPQASHQLQIQNSKIQNPPDPPFVETAEGEQLNIVLGYESSDLRHLSQSTIDAYLVNDSNYYLYFSYLTRANDDAQWTNRYSGIVEPATQVLLGEVDREDLPEMDRVAIQYIAFKQGREFDAKAPAWIELKLDTTKFFKLHCFQRNPYFDTPVIALDIVRNDRPSHEIEIDPVAMRDAMRQKSAPAPRASTPSQKRQFANEPLVIDLHINELVDNTNGLTNTDMLNLQLDKMRQVMDANLNNKGKKIVFIHGKGDGVLRKALLKELAYRYKKCEPQDASFREYGFGATQVTIK